MNAVSRSVDIPPPRRGRRELVEDTGVRLGLHIKSAEQAMMAAKTEALRRFGLTVAQYAAMLSLYYVPEQSSAQLARAAAVTPQTMATVIAKLDPRILIVWYLFFGLVPWFVNDLWFLMACFLLVVVTTKLARVAGLVLLVFAVGVFSQTGYLLLVSLLFGGNASTIAPLLVLSLKVATCSLASVTVFSGLDPDKLSNGLMWFGCPERLSFSISYAYRVLPMLMEEFQNILLSFRLRGNPPSRESLWGKVKYLFYQVKVVMHAFYPLMLNTAKRSRTTVEALEIRGYRNAATNKAVKRMKLATLKVSTNDLLFLAISLLWISLAILLSTLI